MSKEHHKDQPNAFRRTTSASLPFYRSPKHPVMHSPSRRTTIRKAILRLSRDAQLSVSRCRKPLLLFIVLFVSMLILSTLFDFSGDSNAERVKGATCGCNAVRKLSIDRDVEFDQKIDGSKVALAVEGIARNGVGTVVGVVSITGKIGWMKLLGAEVRWGRDDVDSGVCGCWGRNGGGQGRYLVFGTEFKEKENRIVAAEILDWDELRDLGLIEGQVGRGLGLGWDTDAEPYRVAEDSDENPGQVSVVAACRDRGEGLEKALRSWEKLRGIAEIIVVDYGSRKKIQSNGDRVTVVRVNGVSEEGWILSRAYNVAVRVAKSKWILRVDCDSVLPPDFVERLERRSGQFYAGDWREVKDIKKQLHMNGLLFVDKPSFIKVGGYDERIVTYGWEDTDIVRRLRRTLERQTFDLTDVHHIDHTSDARTTSQKERCLLSPENPFAAAVEIQRNRILTTKIDGVRGWTASSPHIRYSVWKPLNSHDANLTFSVTESISPITDIVASEKMEDASKRAIRIILRQLGAPTLPKSYTLNFFKQLIGQRAFPDRYANVTVGLEGGVAARIIEYAYAKAVLKVQGPSDELFDWRARFLWFSHESSSLCPCDFSSVFLPHEYLVFDSWKTFDDSEKWWKDANEDKILKVSASSQRGLLDNLRDYGDLVREERLRAGRADGNNVRLHMNAICGEVVTGGMRKRLREELRNLLPQVQMALDVAQSLESMQPFDAINSVEEDAREEDLRSTNWARQMAITWSGGKSVSKSHERHRLTRRAAAVTSLAQNGRGQRLPAKHRGKLDKMFLGCNEQPKDYLNAYPELAIILSALFSTNKCTE